MFEKIIILLQVLLGGVRKIFLGGGRGGLEDYEDGAAFRGGEGGDGSVKVRMGRASEVEMEVLAGSGVIGGVEEQADELSAIIGSGKKREKRGAEKF
jgi:hypothetical protein